LKEKMNATGVSVTEDRFFQMLHEADNDSRPTPVTLADAV
jgi:hypothetical protein